MIQVADETKRIVQSGNPSPLGGVLQEAVELMRYGAIGQVTVAKAYHIVNEWPNGIGIPPDGPPSEWEWGLGSGPRRRCPATTGSSTDSAGSITTREGSLLTSELITWT